MMNSALNASRTRTRRSPLAALAASVAGLALAAGAAHAEPAMWVVRDSDSTIYLLGTVHVLKPSVVWRTPKIDKALDEAKDLTLEILDVEGNAAALGPLMQQLGIDAAHPLSSKFTPEENKRLAAVAASLGAPAAALDPLRPWLAGLQLSVAPLIKAGYDPNSGVDRLIKAAAVAQGDKVQAFETLEQQLRFFADLPESVQLEFLRQTLNDFDTASVDLDKLANAWVAGDTVVLEDILINQFRAEAPRLYDDLIVKRNQAWADSIAEKLKGSGVSFIAVGTAHLVGPDSVQADLAKRGIRAERF